jgi:hypothetical protein
LLSKSPPELAAGERINTMSRFEFIIGLGLLLLGLLLISTVGMCEYFDRMNTACKEMDKRLQYLEENILAAASQIELLTKLKVELVVSEGRMVYVLEGD